MGKMAQIIAWLLMPKQKSEVMLDTDSPTLKKNITWSLLNLQIINVYDYASQQSPQIPVLASTTLSLSKSLRSQRLFPILMTVVNISRSS